MILDYLSPKTLSILLFDDFFFFFFIKKIIFNSFKINEWYKTDDSKVRPKKN